MRTIAIFGGTFDPVHNGHIETSLAIQSIFHFDCYSFLPCKLPTLKAANIATAQQRIDMLRLAIKEFPQFNIDLREVERDSPSYMVDTLTSVKNENKNASITLILGYDAFLSLPQWYQWKKIITLANLLVMNRQAYTSCPVPEAITELLMQHGTQIKERLLAEKAGVIYLFDAGNHDISSTKIRSELKKNTQIENKIPKEVYQYINQQKLYR